MAEMGRWLLFMGIALAVVGGLFLLLGRVPGLGRLPGDINMERGNVRVFAPCGTMILLSILLTIVLNLLIRLRR